MQEPRVKSSWEVTLAGGRAGHRICRVPGFREWPPSNCFQLFQPHLPWLARESVTAAALKETVEATPPLVTGYDGYVWVPWRVCSPLACFG